MTMPGDVETPGYRLHPALLAYPWFRWMLLAGWLAGAAAIWWDAATGPFTGAIFVPAALLCLGIAAVLAGGYRHVLFHFATGLDERETALRAHVYRVALGITAVATLVVWGWIFMAAEAGNGWQLKEIAYLLPLTLLAAPGAAAALTLPKDEP
jgi:hypothetical protein